jgi:hypothetical protein
VPRLLRRYGKPDKLNVTAVMQAERGYVLFKGGEDMDAAGVMIAEM